MFFFSIKLFIEIIVHLHTVLRNNTERFFVSSTQCPPKVVSSKIIVQHHNLDLDIEYNPLIFRITQFYSTHVCVYLVLGSFLACCLMYLPLQCLSTQESFTLAFLDHTYFPSGSVVKKPLAAQEMRV